MNKLTVNVVTRGRPELLLKTLECNARNLALPNSTLMVSVDEDDQATIDCLKNMPKDDRILISVKPRENAFGAKFNRALSESPSDLYMFCTDYAAILTPGYDEKMLKAARIWPDGIGVVYSDMCDELVPMLQAPTAKLAEKMGYLYNPAYPFWFVDHELADMAWMIGRINFSGVNVDVSRRPNKTQRMRDLAFWTAYYDLTELERRAKARAIINSPDYQSPDWLKQQLCGWWPLLKKRSEARNARVRANAQANEQARGEPESPADEGYVSVKTQAELKLTELYQAIVKAAA